MSRKKRIHGKVKSLVKVGATAPVPVRARVWLPLQKLRWSHLRRWWLALLIAASQTTIQLAVRLQTGWNQNNPNSLGNWRGLVSAILVMLLFAVLHYLCSRRPWVHFWARITLLLIYSVLLLYRFHQGFPLRFGLVFNNFTEAFASASLSMMVAAFPFWLLPLVGVLLAAIIYSEVRLAAATLKTPMRLGRLALVSLAYLLVAFSKPKADMLTNFLYTAVIYHEKDNQIANLKDDAVVYPYMKIPANPTPPGSALLTDAPHVFIVLLESFNAHFVEAKAEDGREFTPFFNELVQQGAYFEKFYGNSVQTARGQVTALCGILDGYKGKIFTSYPQLRMRCLPEIMREQGYTTLFFKAFSDISFDGTGAFGMRHGFDVVRGMDDALKEPGMEKYVWGWGLQDNMFYRKFFSYLDAKKLELEGADAKTPARFFSVLHTVSNHYNFNSVPADQRFLFPQPQNRQQVYANSLYVADLYLREFFEQLQLRPYLKNSLIILLGDHSFPAGEHGGFSNEWGAYEESFRTPMLVVWKDHLQPTRIGDIAASQLDLAPTVLDLLHIQTANHFVGVPMLGARPHEQHVLPLIQPYNGTLLVTMLYPHKYVYQIDSNTQYYFNVAADPLEQHNALEESRNDPIFQQLLKETDKIHLNQKLIDEDRIWPPAP